jgi:hypothetical protein
MFPLLFWFAAASICGFFESRAFRAKRLKGGRDDHHAMYANLPVAGCAAMVLHQD